MAESKARLIAGNFTTTGIPADVTGSTGSGGSGGGGVDSAGGQLLHGADRGAGQQRHRKRGRSHRARATCAVRASQGYWFRRSDAGAVHGGIDLGVAGRREVLDGLTAILRQRRVSGPPRLFMLRI